MDYLISKLPDQTKV